MLGDRSAISTVGKSLRDQDRCVRLVAEIAFADLCRREFGDRLRRRLDLARRHIDGERYPQAEALLASLTVDWPDFGEAWYLQAIVKFCRRDFVHAISFSRRAAALNPNHFSAHAVEAKAWLELGKPSRALAAFRRSFVINPSQTGVQEYIDVLTRQVGTRGGNN
jgi:tetratricopeptide (TPR) repeat protein